MTAMTMMIVLTLVNLRKAKERVELENAQATVVEAFEKARSRAATGFGEKKQ